ncbi:hypothetical protein GWI33_003048 [Rhynchophorus ferrugineus]|uniref:Uncharacterized protein n=1 Tax=Rhynchophorus ferrugineus TaxID=354439 RepID=A0A834IQL8_RHYFE|nr:hypothetical protein GWI33_003048 [Rhynchophorus ferrugineus]
MISRYLTILLCFGSFTITGLKKWLLKIIPGKCVVFLYLLQILVSNLAKDNITVYQAQVPLLNFTYQTQVKSLKNLTYSYNTNLSQVSTIGTNQTLFNETVNGGLDVERSETRTDEAKYGFKRTIIKGVLDKFEFIPLCSSLQTCSVEARGLYYAALNFF